MAWRVSVGSGRVTCRQKGQPGKADADNMGGQMLPHSAIQPNRQGENMPRQLTLFEWLDATLKEAHRVEARANALAEDMVAALDATRHDLLASFARLQEKYLFTPDWQSETFTRKANYLRAQREAVDALLSEVYAGMKDKIADAAEDAMISATATATTMMEPFAAIIQPGAASVTTDLLKGWLETQTVDGLLINEWLGKMERAAVDRIVLAGRESLILGHGSREAAAFLRQKGINGSIPGLEALARTFLLSASNFAREASIERMTEGTGILKGWRYCATLDGRTCAVCGADDEKIVPADAPRTRLPRHINCRCVWLPVSKTFEELGLTGPDLPLAERPAVKHEAKLVHHKDGSTSTRYRPIEGETTLESYSQWIARQLKEDPDFVRSIFGKTRFELLASGKLTLDKMVVDGRIKRLSELPKP